MVMVAQLAERRNVAPEATGSIPVRHPELQVTGNRLQQATTTTGSRRLSPVPCPLSPGLHPGGGTADSPGSDPGGRTALRVRIPPGVLRMRGRCSGQPAEGSVQGRTLSPVPVMQSTSHSTIHKHVILRPVTLQSASTEWLAGRRISNRVDT